MKKIILLFSFLYTTITFSQTVDSTTTSDIFHYRISLSDVTSPTLSQDVKSQMFDIFKTKVDFNDELNQFMFSSAEDLDEHNLLSKLNAYQIIYFKKTKLN